MLDRENVVLVTGAGASRPYGYPTGEELTREIIEGLRERNSPLSRAVGLAVPGEPDLRDLARRLAASDRGSVDAFLQPDCNAGLRDAARAAIAWILLSREKQVSRPQDGDWIRYLFGAMLDDVRSPDDLQLSKVSVVTFNFDCYLEHAWQQALFENFGLQGEELRRLARVSLPVHHVNGALRPGRCDGEGGMRDRGFGDGHVDDWYLKHYSPGLLFFHDGRHGVMPSVESALRRADVVAFLGFSFQTANVRRLGLPEAWNAQHRGPNGLRTFASGKGLSPAERELASERVCGGGPAHLSFAGTEDDCLATLRQFPVLRF